MKTVDVIGAALTPEQVAKEGFSGSELICDPFGNVIGRRYYKWWTD